MKSLVSNKKWTHKAVSGYIIQKVRVEDNYIPDNETIKLIKTGKN